MSRRLIIQRIGCLCWLLLALALLLPLSANIARAQGIVYGRFPPSSPVVFPYDAQGTRLWAADPSTPQTFDLVIGGQTAYTFYSGTEFAIVPSSLNAVIAVQPGLPSDPSPFAKPLTQGQKIGPDAAGDSWVPDIPGIGGSTLTASRDIGSIGYFTGVESAYIGLQFHMNGRIYYGWVRAGAPVTGINGGWIYDYAYETQPDTPINAGAGAPIPFTANFTGKNEVLPNTSTHSGTGSFTFDGNTLSYYLELDGTFQPTSAGIFGPANPGLNSPRLVADLGTCGISSLSPIPFPPIGPVTFDLNRSPIILPAPIILVRNYPLDIGDGLGVYWGHEKERSKSQCDAEGIS